MPNKDTQRLMDIYHKRRSQGICVRCGRSPAINGQTKCHPCKEKHKKSSIESKNRHRTRATKEGLCSNCTRPAVIGKKKCSVCLDVHRNISAKRRKEARAGGRCTRCSITASPGRTLCEEHLKIESQEQRKRKQAQKQRVMNAYGGKCSCCGLEYLPALNIDHIDNGGAEHRKIIGAGNLYPWLDKHKCPDGFQVLCANCNLVKHLHGECTIPH